MRSPHATIHWLAALIIASLAVATSTFILEIITARKSSLMVQLSILEAHTVPQPTVSDFTTAELARKISAALAGFIIITTPIISLFALLPAFIVSNIWETSSKFPSMGTYAIGGLVTGLSFSFFAVSPLAPLGHEFFAGPELTALRFIFLGATAGLVGGCVFGWRRRCHFRLFLRRTMS